MKKLSLILIVVCLIATTLILCGCNSFAWSDDEDLTSIEKIERIMDSEGNYFIEIHYTNIDRIDRFPLPEGNGIENIEYVDNEEERVTVVTITYTNGNTTVVNVPYGKDGEDGSSMNMVMLEKNMAGEPVLKFYEQTAEGNISEKGSINIKELKGKDGLGFEQLEFFSDEIGSGVLVKLTGETDPTIYYLNYKKNVSVDLQGNYYILTISSADPDSIPEVISLPRMATWLQGDDYPQKSLGMVGDFYFDRYHKIIYSKIEDLDNPGLETWKMIADLNTNNNNVFTVSFDAGNGTIPGYDQYKTTQADANIYELKNIPYNSYFYDRYGSIPVPVQEGYTFLGWYRSLTPTVGEAAFNDFVLVTNNISLIARWGKID